MIDHFGERILFPKENYTEYSRDASEISCPVSALFFAKTENEVIEIINISRRQNIPIVFRGAGTGYTGGAVPVKNALVLSLEKMKKLEIFPEMKYALCGPGVITKDLMNESVKHNLFYPPDPASYEESTLGGNVAENAGGLHCKKYGVTKDYIIGLKAVTIDGALIKTGLYAENDLFNISQILTGSEGLLAAVTEIAFRLIDLPHFGPTILAAFENPDEAAGTVSEIIAKGVIPSVMEYMDGDAVACSNEYEKSISIENARAILLIETSGDRAESEADHIERICRAHHTNYIKRENKKSKADILWKIRRNLSKAVKASAVRKISEDVCVPPSKLPELVAFVAEMNARLPFRINSYGHAGDGNLHVNFLAASESSEETAMIDDCVKKLFDKTLQLGGTLTGEHGIGLTKIRFLPLEFDRATLAKMKQIKSVFDDGNLLNPGKMFS
ncbi:MAG: FAD-linked oxidase C-terminal domain-containing protein [Candidatus Zixiibacteriota bacterium]